MRDEELDKLAVEEGRRRDIKLRKEIEAIQGPLPDEEDNDRSYSCGQHSKPFSASSWWLEW
jgi:hypothetical protein